MDRPFGELAGKAGASHLAAAAPAQSYVGTYANDYWGPACCHRHRWTLTPTLGPKGQAFPLKHWDGEMFTFDVTK